MSLHNVVMALVDFHVLLGSSDDHFDSIWRSLDGKLGPFYNEMGHRCIKRNTARSQTRVWMIFAGFCVCLGKPFWNTFFYFLLFEASKSMFGSQAWLLPSFDLKICWFLTSPPLNLCGKYWCFQEISVFRLLQEFDGVRHLFESHFRHFWNGFEHRFDDL